MSRQPYFEHDNRGPSTSKFRGSSNNMGRRKKFRDNNRPSRRMGPEFEGDVDMMTGNDMDRRRFEPYSFKKNRKKMKNHSKNKGHYKHGHSDQPSWFRISINYGRKLGKSFILGKINNLVKEPFIPVNFQFNHNHAEFYINNSSMAYHIKDISRQITTPEGFKLSVTVTRVSTPVASIDPEAFKLIEQCMSNRYDAITHVLNLHKFYHDENLKNAGLYTPMNKPNVFNTVVKIIKENIPEIEALNLSDNKIYTLEPLSVLLPVCKQLKSLILKDNKLRSVSELNHLKGLGIVELILDGNQLCDEFKDKTSYISAVRERFPKLMSLDGHELPAHIGFDLGVETCPASKKCFFAESEGPAHKDLVIQFLDQYYTIYDSGDRKKLLDAYHEEALFSLTLSNSAIKNNGSSLSTFYRDNRNLLKLTDYHKRFKLLKQGNLSIVAALSEMPQTMHDPTSFSVDIFHISAALMSFSVIGVFKEVGAEINNASLKSFHRTFIVVPHSSGIAIINETLFIAHASQDQIAKAFKVPAPTPSPSPAPSNEEKSPSEKQLMVVQLSNQTEMNMDFSAKCLEENDWDYQRAIAVFMNFHSQGKIPPEAFIKI